jgi:hypothetical protein
MARLSKRQLAVVMTDTLDAVDHGLEIVVRYHLESDSGTSISKTTIFELPFVRPFEANYDFLCQHDPQPFPNFFELSQAQPLAPSTGDHDEQVELGPSTARGVHQKYTLVAKVYSFALEAVLVEKIALTVQNVTGGAVCHATPGRRRSAAEKGPDLVLEHAVDRILPDETQHFEFTIDVQKGILGDRHPVALDLALHIQWRRVDDNESAMAILEIPRYLAPMAEPRVLVTAQSNLQARISGLRHLVFTIENPSMHFLTFNISMESSEDFAFSGPKATDVSLVPLSKHDVEYRIISSKTSEWIRVNLAVVDVYFGKSLRIHPANDLVRADKKHNLSVWIE